MAHEVGLKLVEEDCMSYYSHESKAKASDSAVGVFRYLRMAGCCIRVLSRIATGGDGVVYRASNSVGEDVAAKLYLCPSPFQMLVRFDFNPADIATQDRYEFRTRAHAEYDALMRMNRAGVRCPAPIKIVCHVLVMEFIGKDGVPAPTLSVARLCLDQLQECYNEAVKIMRTLYQKCGLVHGHLNETNMLYHEGHLYVIDGSQCIRTHHDYASEVLKKDCARVLRFFGARSIDVMTVKELFDFVRDPSLTDDDSFDSYLETIQQMRLRGRKGKSKAHDKFVDPLLAEDVANEGNKVENVIRENDKRAAPSISTAASSASGVSGAETDSYGPVSPTGRESKRHKVDA